MQDGGGPPLGLREKETVQRAEVRTFIDGKYARKTILKGSRK